MPDPHQEKLLRASADEYISCVNMLTAKILESKKL
jgi:hypothetical protein